LRYFFENYAFDTDRRELHRGADIVSVAPQVFDLLDYLICNRQRVVSKDDLINVIWNGRSVSDAALTTRLNAARTAIGDSGEEQRLIKTLPRKGFRFVGQVREAQEPAGVAGDDNPIEPPKPALPLPDKPSVAVLPFTNLSSDPEQDYFTDGMVEEIITALSRFHWLFVIARTSTFTYKGRKVDVKQVSRELGVRYVLEGSVRKAGNRVRITAQLIDATTRVHLWSDRFEAAFDNIFELQDQVASGVVGAIDPKLLEAEIARVKRKAPANYDAYDCFLRASALIHQWTTEGRGEALRLFYKAIELDPDYGRAYAFATMCYCWRKVDGLAADPDNDRRETERLAREAIRLGRDDAFSLSHAGLALAQVVGELNEGAALIERALALNPNLAGSWNMGGWVRLWLNQPDAAIDHFARAMRLSPLDFGFHAAEAGTAFAHIRAGRYEEASVWAERALRGQPRSADAAQAVALSSALVGDLEKAKIAIRRLLEIAPSRRISTALISKNLPPKARARFVDILREAGMPE